MNGQDLSGYGARIYWQEVRQGRGHRLPRCSVKMDKVVDPKQTHIWMESCPSCYRVFLDAGEFSDLKYETFSDRIKNLLKGRRR